MTKSRFRFGRRALATVAFASALAVVLAACGSSSSGKKSSSSGGAATPTKSLTVGSKNFGAAQVLSHLYGGALAAKGYKVTYKDNIGATEIVYKALQNGDIDLYGEYQGTLLQSILNGTPTSDRQTTYDALKAKLPSDLVATTPAEAIDVNGFYVLKSTADKYHLKTISDLKPVAGQLVFGGTPECQERPLCLGTKEQQLYGLQFKDVKKLDEGGPVTEKALDDGTIQVALLFTGSSVIKPNYVLLQDDKGLQPADNPIALVRKSVDSTQLNSIIDSVNAKLTTDAYNKLALQVQNEKQDPATVADAFLKENGLG